MRTAWRKCAIFAALLLLSAASLLGGEVTNGVHPNVAKGFNPGSL